MTILPSSASTLARQVRLKVSPPTTTLFESRAVLSEAQSRFGPISTFINPRNDPTLRLLRLQRPAEPASSQSIIAIFDSSASKVSALGTSPFTITCGGDLVPSPKELDPYNARGFHGRFHPPKRTFICEIVEEDDPKILDRLAESNPYGGPFYVNPTEMSYGDLMGSGAPLQGTADVMQTERTFQSRRETGLQGSIDPAELSKDLAPLGDNGKEIQEEEGFMTAWRQGIANQTKNLEDNTTGIQ